MTDNIRPTLVFATNNAHKLQELRQIAGEQWHIVSLAEIGCHDDIPETSDTLQGNALQKARYIKEHYGYDCFADDTGLMVDALGGEPGVYSARYAGPGHDSVANMRLLLERLRKVSGENTSRAAHCSTVIALIVGDEETVFEGRVDGVITDTPDGEGGFGYDPIFLPDESDRTFASMSAQEKNRISHRGRATAKLLAYLEGLRPQL